MDAKQVLIRIIALPKERLVVQLNKDIIFDEIGKDIAGNPTSYRYFWYPDPIREISVMWSYQGKITFHKVFRDTLVDVLQRSVFISSPFPKGMTKETYRPYGYIPIDSADRKITLEDDATYYKDSWRF